MGAGLSGCADPVIVDQNFDFGTKPGGDGGMTTSSHYTASPGTKDSLVTEVPPTPDYQQWKRDPSFVIDGTDQYMFYAGSSYTTEQWSVAFFKTTVGTGWPANATLAMRGRSGSWDGKDVFAPSLRVSSGPPKYTVWYAANGDATKPDYVSQIGVATSSDGVTWTRSATPVIATPTFTGTGAADTPTAARPDAYGATDPFVLQDGSNFVMYYAGLDCSTGTCAYRILRSVSTDGGNTFAPGTVVLSGRQGIPEEAGGVAGPSVVLTGGKYLLAYTGVGTAAAKSRAGVRTALTTGSVGIAVSTDGMNFTYAGLNPSAVVVKSSGTSYSEGAGAPSLYIASSNLKMYFTGLISGSGGTYYSLLPADITEIKQ